jgi:hypothetical protein
MTIAPPVELPSSRPARRRLSILRPELTAGWVAVILLGHAVYGLLLVRSAGFATLHAIATFAVALWFALTSTMRRVALVCAYMAGSEILWRMGHARLPWEFVKYAIALVMVITLARVPRLRWDWMSVFYFALLIPSTLLSFFEQDFFFAREQVSFNLSGPLLLCIATWFFAYLRPSRADLQRFAVAVLAPVVSLGLIAMTKAASLDDLSFTDASNFQMSAGYGPNQVSTVLGFGVLLSVLLVLLVERGNRERLLYSLVALLLGVQSALTFSRGGLFAAIGALLLASPFLVTGARNRVAMLVGAVMVVGAVEFVILPKLDAFTGGALSVRFQDTNPTGRDVLVRTELDTFLEHPLFGTGPAALDEYGSLMSSTHTEFTRLLAQHGIFGALALLMMLLLAWRDLVTQESSAGRAIASAFVAWSFLTMLHAAMRLGITPFVFGMAAAAYFVTSRTSRSPGTAPDRGVAQLGEGMTGIATR